MFDVNEKIRKAKKEAIVLSALTILTGGLFLHMTTDNTVEVEASQSFHVHTVDYGDTLWRISFDNDIPLNIFMDANGLSSDLIHPGDQLRIPHKTINNREKVEEKMYGNELTQEQYDTLLMVAQQEGGHDYEAVLAVMSVITNRVDSDLYQDTVWEVITSEGQFEAYGAGHYLRHQNEVTEVTKKAVSDALNGQKNVDVLNFWSDWYYVDSGRNDDEAVNIGGNIFFNM